MDDLTEREKQIYNLICIDGLDRKQIQDKLCISRSTAKKHLNNIFSKKAVTSMAQLIFQHYSGV